MTGHMVVDLPNLAAIRWQLGYIIKTYEWSFFRCVELEGQRD